MGSSLVHLTLDPGTQRVAFWQVTANAETNRYHSALVVLDILSASQQTWAHIDGLPHSLAFSPDGSIVYWVGSELWKSWSPTSKQCFVRLEQSLKPTTYSLSYQTNEIYCATRRSLTEWEPAVFHRLPYKRDGRGYLGEEERIRRISPDGEVSGDIAVGSNPVVSPDGNFLLYMTRQDDVEDNLDATLMLTHLSNGKTRVIRGPRSLFYVRWSPDSRQFAVLGRDATIGTPVPPGIWIGDLTSAKMKLIRLIDEPWLQTGDGADWKWPIGSPTLAWAHPNQVLVGEVFHGTKRLVGVGLDGTCSVITTDKADYSEGVADPESGQMLAIRHDCETLDEIVVINPPNVRALTQYNRRSFVLPEEYWVPGNDGDAIHTFLLRSQVKARGTILAIHGGPHNAFTRQVHLLHQALSQNGWHVIYANPHGSIGYGQEYASSLAGHWGRLDEQDWKAIVRFFQERQIFQEPLGVMGASYGGFMATWLLGRWPMIKAAVVQAPVANQIDMLWSSDIGYTFTVEGCQIDLNDRDQMIETLWKNSPMREAHRITAPVLLLHGSEDHRCPLSQSEALFIQLKQNHTPVEFVVYQGESHLMTAGGRPRMRIDRFQRIIDWFDHYLTGS